MIVLDEQLLSYGVQASIARWYRGAVTDITQLRPNTVILDKAIPMLLRAVSRPTFVTINVADFWRRIAIDRHFCAICFAISDSDVRSIPDRLRSLLLIPALRTKARRMGKVLRVSKRTVSYYDYLDSWIRRLSSS